MAQPGPSQQPSRHRFYDPLFHPIVAIMQHTTSPLTATLAVFSFHKWHQRAAMDASLRASYTLFQAGELPFVPRLSASRVAWVSSAMIACAVFSAGWHRQSPPAAAAAAVPPLAPATRAALVELWGERDASRVAGALSTGATVAAVVRALRAVRERLALPWSATLVASTLTLRLALVPLNAALLRNSLRLKLAARDVARLRAALRGAGAGAGGAGARLAAARELQGVFARARASPWAQCLLFPLLLPAVILTGFTAVHDLCLSGAGMDAEGALWFRDLMERDRTNLLPIASALSWIANVEIGGGAGYASLPGARLAARLLAASTVPLAATLPSGILLFWVTSNAFSFARGIALRSPRVRRALRIPLQAQIDACASK
jgi:inner membrane protein COX18